MVLISTKKSTCFTSEQKITRWANVANLRCIDDRGKISLSFFGKLSSGRWNAKSHECAHVSDKCIANCRCKVLNATVARRGAIRDGRGEEDKEMRTTKGGLSEERRAISSRPPTLKLRVRWRIVGVATKASSANATQPNGLIMSPAEIIEPEIVRPIFLLPRILEATRTDFPPRLESAHRIFLPESYAFKTSRWKLHASLSYLDFVHS